jgi:hypothetical protein
LLRDYEKSSTIEQLIYHKVDIEESIVNARRKYVLQITDQLFKSKLTCCVVCGFTLLTVEWCGAFTIDSARPNLRINEHPILVTADFSQWLFNLFTNELDSRVPCKYPVAR